MVQTVPPELRIVTGDEGGVRMTSDEARAVGRLGGRIFGDVVSQVQQVHEAVANRVFRPMGPLGLPTRAAHDAIAHSVYAGIRGAGTAVGAQAGLVLSVMRQEERQLGSLRSTNLALAVLNAIAGDRLADERDPLAIRMALRKAGRDVVCSPAVLAETFPNATSRLAVFVHGLGETEDSWRPGQDEVARVSYGTQLKTMFDYTAVYVRYNTGRHISENGADLSRLLGQLVAAWPVGVEEVLLVGHSMGGLVIRSACHDGRAADHPWVAAVRHVFYLGSPHLGAPLARGAGFLGKILAATPETRPFARLVNGSSSGVKDLRFGYVLEEDWADCAQDTCLRNHRHDSPLLEGANHYAISVTVTADPSRAVGRLVGDLLVQPASAHGRHRRHQHIAFPVEDGRQLGGMHHFDLLSRRDIWAEMESLLDPRAQESPGGRDWPRSSDFIV